MVRAAHRLLRGTLSKNHLFIYSCKIQNHRKTCCVPLQNVFEIYVNLIL